MPLARVTRIAVLLASALLMLVLIGCAGFGWQARRGALEPFLLELPLWPGVELTVLNGPQGVCHPYQFCPPQIGLQAGLSVWMTHHLGGGQRNGRRLLFWPSSE